MYTTAMLAFDMSNKALKGLSGDYPSDLHITLLFMGEHSNLNRAEVEKRIQAFADTHAPIKANFSGYAAFAPTAENDNKAPVVALLDGSDLPAFRQSLYHSVMDLVPNPNHGFTPHMTLAYVDPNASPSVPTLDMPQDVVLNDITLYWGDERKAFALTGDVVEKQALIVDDKSKRNLLNVRISIFNDKVDALSEKVMTGQISIGQMEEQMKQEVRALHTGSGVIGKGGWSEMTPSDWGKIGAEVKKQYRYLHGFMEDVSLNKGTISLNSIKARAHMYGNAAKHTATLTQAGDFAGGTTRQPSGFSLPYMPRDGSTECLTNCLCHWSLKVVSKTSKAQTVEAKWILAPAEHCQTCIDRSKKTVTIDVPVSIKVPAIIGGL